MINKYSPDIIDGLRLEPMTEEGRLRARQIGFLTAQGIPIDTAVSNAADFAPSTQFAVGKWSDGSLEIFTNPLAVDCAREIATPADIAVTWMNDNK